MTHRNGFAGMLTALSLFVALASTMAPCFAQQRVRDVDERRAHPEKGFFESSRTSRHIGNARRYSNDVYYYSRAPRQMSVPVIRSESALLGQEIQHARREVAGVATAINPTPTQADSLKAITGHLDKATEHHKELHTECAKEAPNAAVCARCASLITKELDKAHAEQEALGRDLEIATGQEEPAGQGASVPKPQSAPAQKK